ncbi:MAG: hypothetical protein DI535_23390 [Citrobacter freundii]|nr:MAG: hypothetical protein DI535_23390 [Citrobacter freundii]
MKIFSTLIVAMLVFCTLLNAQNNVGVGTTTPDASAMLDVSSTTQGMLIPRMSLAQRNLIASPATGLLVYQTDNTPGFYMNSGTAAVPNWQPLGGTALPAQSGNSGKFLTTNGTALSWGTPSGTGGATVDLVATTNTAMSLISTTISDVAFSVTSVAPTLGSFDGTTYTVGTSGTYLVSVNLISTSANIALYPRIITSSGTVWGVGSNSSNLASYGAQGFGNASSVFTLTAGQTIKVQVTTSSSTGGSLAATALSRIVITKL